MFSVKKSKKNNSIMDTALKENRNQVMINLPANIKKQLHIIDLTKEDLAKQTKDSVKNVSEQIQKINNQIQNMSENCNNVDQLVVNGTNNMEETNNFFDNIVTSIMDSKKQSMNIEIEINQISEVIKEINNTVTQLVSSANALNKLSLDL